MRSFKRRKRRVLIKVLIEKCIDCIIDLGLDKLDKGCKECSIAFEQEECYERDPQHDYRIPPDISVDARKVFVNF